MSMERGRPQERQNVVVVSEPDPRRRELLRAHLEGTAPREDRDEAGLPKYPRYGIRFAHDCDEALRLIDSDVAALVLNLTTGRTGAVKAIETLRPTRPDLAILCYVTAAPRADAMAAIMAGADHVAELSEGQFIDRALDLALDRRWLAQLIERSAADLEEARGRLARLGGNSSVVLPGLRPPAAADAVLPFNEAVRRYLEACTRLFEGDPRGLAERLGVSYFALRRLLKRYSVQFPRRNQPTRARGPTPKRSSDTKR